MNKPNNITQNDWNLLTEKYKDIHKIEKKLNKNYPVQYLIGNVDFYGYPILVNKNVLIPRFETETLIEKTITYIKKYKLEKSNVLELGTGSGCISIVLKKEIPSLNIDALEISSKALKVAKKNAVINKVTINFIKKDLFKFKPKNKYDILISNPPYVKYDDIVSENIKYEPKKAIYASDNGLKYYKFILPYYKNSMNKKSILAFEIGYKDGEILKKLAVKEFLKAKVIIEKDLSGKDRYLFIINE